MARNIYSRLHLRGTLVTQSPLHVGGHGEEVDTDLPLARDGAGQLYVPGTSLAGALRELAERLFGEDVINNLWGFQDGNNGHASFVVVEDAVIENSNSVVVEIRDHVGIDREYGSAAEHIKYDRAILPRGTRLRFHVSVEVLDSRQRSQALAMLAALRDALQAGEVRLGAAKTRGLGHIRLEDIQLTDQVFNNRQAILATLRQPLGAIVSQADIEAAKQAHPVQKRPRLTLKIHWKPLGPLMVKAGFDGIASDMLPLVSQINGGVSLVLPGSSIKGTFRSQAERIVRTVLNDVTPAWLDREGKRKFLDAVSVPLVDELFGAAKQAGSDSDSESDSDSDSKSPNAPKESRKQTEKQVEKHTENTTSSTPEQKRNTKPWLGLGALGATDCYGRHPLTVAQWQAIQAATDDRQLRQALNQAGLQPWSQAYHVAIDRWLGSAAESMLYTVLEPHRTEWEPITLEVNLQRLPNDLQLPGLALLLLVIRDLANDRLPLGFATHRGMGTITVMHLSIQGHDLEGDLAQLGNIQIHNGRFQNLPDALKTAWQRWVANKQQGAA